MKAAVTVVVTLLLELIIAFGHYFPIILFLSYLHKKNTSIINNFSDDLKSIRIFEYNKPINSLPGVNYIGPEIRGRKINGGSAYTVISFKNNQSYFWQQI